eukprot:CAMPEP_0175167938 /NCGR_PEP_ID=MMETSP0087-20121206/28652_1 /TAXON_ID=136419 /ORGANISM="Unknown Unknown, Strain D1" /LENGTH=59 /DNA_ID=CAMNT_0016457947 /DNA_START=84 /DNA_END=260 /DNA_ORIENTATION=+
MPALLRSAAKRSNLMVASRVAQTPLSEAICLMHEQKAPNEDVVSSLMAQGAACSVFVKG